MGSDAGGQCLRTMEFFSDGADQQTYTNGRGKAAQ